MFKGKGGRMNVFIKILWIIVLISFSSCNRHVHDEKSNEKSTDHQHNEGSKEIKRSKNERKELKEEQRKEVKKLFEINERLHSAFFEYDANKVEMISKEMIKAIKKISNTDISQRLEFSKEILGNIKSSEERKENNQNYHLFSMALIHLLDNFEIDNKYKAYSCPMVKMQWVQNVDQLEKVHNPYAPEMPHCGEMQ